MDPHSFCAAYNDAALVAASARAGHPTLHVQVELTRAFSRAALCSAAARVIQRFPVLGCRYVKGFWRDRWTHDDASVESIVHCAAAPEGLESDRAWTRQWLERGIDPLRERPFRIVQRSTAQGASLLVSVLHAASDAAGVGAVVRELACCLCDVRLAPLPAADRGLRQLVRATSWRARGALLLDVLQEATVRPVQLLKLARRTTGRSNPAVTRACDWRTLTLDGAAYEAFRRRCSQAGATLNDGLLAVLAGIAEAQTPSGAVAVYYTANLRRLLPEPVAVAANLSCGEFVVVPRDAAREPARALSHVTRITRRQKQRSPGLAIALQQLAMNGWLPHAWLRVAVANAGEAFMRALFERVLLVTNVGPLDAYLAPFGADLRRASMLGPFVAAAPLPVIMVTGLRASLTAQICAGAGLPTELLDSLAEQLGRALHGTEPAAACALQ